MDRSSPVVLASGYWISEDKKGLVVRSEWNILVNDLDPVPMGGYYPDFGPVVIAGRPWETDSLTYGEGLRHIADLNGTIGTGEHNIDFRNQIHTHATIEGVNYLRVDRLPVALHLNTDRPVALYCIGGARCSGDERGWYSSGSGNGYYCGWYCRGNRCCLWGCVLCTAGDEKQQHQECNSAKDDFHIHAV